MEKNQRVIKVKQNSIRKQKIKKTQFKVLIRTLVTFGLKSERNKNNINPITQPEHQKITVFKACC